jgi:hypothetical protein
MTPRLKHQKLTIDPTTIWQDDALDRKKSAETLTNFIADEPYSLVLSLNGGWGTGKTFLLERWQKDLEQKGYKALYFNAWEDDFCGDPLIAIIGQLWNHLKGSDFTESVKSLKETAGGILRQSILVGSLSQSLSITGASITNPYSHGKPGSALFCQLHKP